jgi:hypothetical protein
MHGGYFLGGILFSGSICLIFLALFLLEVRHTRHVPLFSAEWRGLGGGLGGWRISKPFTFILIAIVFGTAALALIAQKVQHDHADGVERAKHEYELRRLAESEERKYRDAELARRAELEKVKFGSTTSAAGTEKKPSGTGAVAKP